MVERNTMDIGAISAMQSGGATEPTQQQIEASAQLLIQMYALQASTEMQGVAALALIQSAMGIGENIDHLA
jgi:hypothetical protein